MAESYASQTNTSSPMNLPLNNAAEKPMAMGMTPTQWVQLLNSNEAKAAKKALDYYDGKQMHQMIITLNDMQSGRRKWRERGMLPRFRNLTKMIVGKSGMLFKDALPTMEVFVGDSNTPDENQTTSLNDELWKIEWAEFCQNLDEITRLLKTTIVLTQYDSDKEELVFDILTRANSCALVRPGSREIDALIYVTSSNSAMPYYRVITKEWVYDLCEISGKITISNSQPNSLQAVPASPFYDTAIPRSGFWVDEDCDLVQLNEMYNLSLIDTEYCIQWQKKPTLFSNMNVSADSTDTVETVLVGTNRLPRQTTGSPEMLAGPGSLVVMDSAGVDSPFMKYDGPSVDLLPLDQVVEGWVSSFAADWAVRVKVSGTGSATSGFQLIVEEMDNMELRKVRQRMFENGFKRLFTQIKIVMNSVSPGMFSDNAELSVEFNEPYLPVEMKVQEEVWSTRITSGRATEIDYFMHVLGLSKEEAEAKYAEIVKFNAEKAELVTAARAEARKGEQLSTPLPDDDPTNDPVLAKEAIDVDTDTTQQIDSGGSQYPVKTGSKSY